MADENVIIVSPLGDLEWKGKHYKCAIGKNGVAQDKKEGDAKTPVGEFLLRGVLYRADKLGGIATELPVTKLNPDDGWCDDSADPAYNKQVKLPYAASHESLWRDDDLYDIIVPVGYNDEPPVPQKGSAIFMHVARPTYSGTAGCIALAKEDLLEVLKDCNAETRIRIQPL